VTAPPPEIVLPPLSTTASASSTIALLQALVLVLNPEVVVEAGTYQGHSALTMAWCMHRHGFRGHIWTTDPVDHDMTATLAKNPWAAPYLTYVQRGFADFMFKFPYRVDLGYADASGPDSMLRRDTLDLMMRHLSVGGVCVADDMASFEKDWPGVEDARARADIYIPRDRGICLYQRKK
jgi:predicted O-methyltransferase YrrM